MAKLERTKYQGIFRDPGVRGTVVVAIVTIRLPDGRRRQEKKRFPPATTLETARDWRAARMAEIANGSWVAPSKVTVGELLQRVLEVKQGLVADNSLRAYRFSMKRLVSMHSILVQKLTKRDIDDWRKAALRRKRPYAMRTINTTLQFLDQALTYAQERDVIRKNPMAGYELVSVPPNTENCFALDELARLRVAWAGHEYEVLFEFLACTGVRSGEAFSALLDDIDLDAGLWQVTRTLTGDATGHVIIKEKGTKSLAGVRGLPLTDGLVDLLTGHIAAIRTRMQDEPGWNPLGLLFPGKLGGIGSRDIAQDALDAVCEVAGVERRTFHAFRHGLATAGVNAGVPATDIQQILGHADVATTLRNYVRSDRESRRRAIEVVAAVQKQASVARLLPKERKASSYKREIVVAGEGDC